MTTGSLTLSDAEFYAIRDLLKQRFGINLTEQKRSLVVGRLSGLLRKSGYASFDEFYQTLLNDSTGQSLSSLVDRLSTNHTHFNREAEHYTFFNDIVMPSLGSIGCPRIWIAGCSSGEEAYNVGMLLMEARSITTLESDASILATDISSTALEKAQAGIYTQENIRKLPQKFEKKYFRTHISGNLQVVESLKRLITFRRLNLMRDTFPFKRRFHAIFCRNVMIYFDGPTRVKLAKQFTDLLEPGGYLFIGHSETLGRDTPGLNYVQPAVYRRTAEN